jgi:ADP-heptose:LPS heptosyltransferase
MHLANLLGVPIIAIFGQTNPLITGPIFNGVVKIIEQSQIGKLSHPECDAIINQTLSNAKTNIY